MKKYFLAFLFLPGTFIHELSHFLMAKILFVPVGKFNLIPKTINNEFQLGSVTIAKTDLVRGTLIGLAPFLVGSFLLIYLLFNPISLLSIYLFLQIIHSMLLSFSDLKDFLKLIIISALIILVYYWLR